MHEQVRYRDTRNLKADDFSPQSFESEDAVFVSSLSEDDRSRGKGGMAAKRDLQTMISVTAKGFAGPY